MALGGYIAFFFSILFFSGKITRPVTESYEKQKRFITDAGHEIKTPLAIIRADTEVLEMDLGESEWSSDIKKQTKRLELVTAFRWSGFPSQTLLPRKPPPSLR